MASTQNKNPILVLRNQANSIRDAENAPITPVRVGNLFNDIIDWLPTENQENTGTGLTLVVGGVTNLWSINNSGTLIAGYTLNGSTRYIYIPNNINNNTGVNLNNVWDSLENNPNTGVDTWKDRVIHEKHLGKISEFFKGTTNNPLKNYTWWGRSLSGSGANLTVTGDLKGNIKKITFGNGNADGPSIELDGSNLKVNGNLYATGGISALGTMGEGSGAPTELGQFLQSLKNAGLTVPVGSEDAGKGLVWGLISGNTYGWTIGTVGGEGSGLAPNSWALWFNTKTRENPGNSGYLKFDGTNLEWADDLVSAADYASLSATVTGIKNITDNLDSNYYRRDLQEIANLVSSAVTTYLENNDLENIVGIKPGTIADALNNATVTIRQGYLYYNGSSFEWLLGSSLTKILNKDIDSTGTLSDGSVLIYDEEHECWKAGHIYAPTVPGLLDNLLIIWNDGNPVWANASSITVGNATNATNATNAVNAKYLVDADDNLRLNKDIWGQHYIVDGVPQDILITSDIKVGNIYFNATTDNLVKRSSTFINNVGNIVYNSNLQGDQEDAMFGIYNSRVQSLKYNNESLSLDTGSFIMRFEKNGLVNLPYRPPIENTTNYSDTYRGLRIGNGVLTWEQSTNSFKVYACNSNGEVTGPANFYATGGVSALGIPNTGSGSVQNATITNLNSDTLKVGSYTIKKEETTTQSGSATTHDKDLIIAADSDLTGVEAGSTTTLGKIVFLFPNVNNPLTINKDGIVTSDIEATNVEADKITSPKFYFDATHYLYINNDGDLIYHKGEGNDKNITLNL